MSDASLPGWMIRTSSNVREWLAKSYETINVVGLVSTHGPISLRQIFVPPVLSNRRVAEHAPEAALHEGGRGLPAWLNQAHEGRGPPVLALSGRAGSGKTTLTHWLALSLAQAAQDALSWGFQNRLPVPIALRDAPLARLDGLEALVRWWGESVSGVDPEGLIEWLDYQGTLLVLDGLDEVGGREERERVMSWVREHRWTSGGSGLRNLTLITARPSGFDDVLAYGESDVLRLWMAPFNETQIKDYVSHWFDLPELRGPESERKSRTLLEVLSGPRASESLRTLARRPSYLTVLCAIHHTRGELPHTRAALYKEIISEYIHALDAERGLKTPWGERPAWDHPTDKLEVLSAVAFQAHVGAGASEARPVGDRHMVWRREELRQAVRRAIEDPRARMQRVRPEHAEALTDYFVSRTGLLVETWSSRFQFAHLSFQEYLTARYLVNLAGGTVNLAEFMASKVLPRLAEEGWPEVAMMMLAIDAERGANYGGVLARLAPDDLSHLRFLGKVLAGEELPLSDQERRAWLLAWLFAASDPRRELQRVSVCELEKNRVIFEDFTLAAARALAAGQPAEPALAACFPSSQAPAGSLEALLGGPSSADGQSWEAARRWLEAPRGRWRTSPLAELALAAPLPGQRPAGAAWGDPRRAPPPGLDEALEEIADGVELVKRSNARNRSVSASLWWWVLDGWLRAADGRLPRLEITVSGATPLSALLELPGRVPERLLRSPDALESRLVRWRARTARAVLEAERAMRTAGLDRLSDLDALTLWRRMVDGRHPTRSALKDRPSRRLVEAVPTPTGQRRPFEAWRAIEVYARGYLTFGQREIGEPPAIPPELALEPLMALRSDGADKTWRARWGWGMSSLCFLAELERLSLFSSRPVTRREVEALREKLADEGRRYEGLDAVARAIAADEWERLAASPLNPIGMLDVALKGKWRILAVDLAALDERVPEMIARLGGE